MIRHCTRALYIQISWVPSIWCCEISPVNIYRIQKRNWHASVFGTDDLHQWARKKRNLVVEWLVQGHTHKLKSESGSWTRDFWPAWLEKQTNCVVYAAVLSSVLTFMCNELPEVGSLICWGLGELRSEVPGGDFMSLSVTKQSVPLCQR